MAWLAVITAGLLEVGGRDSLELLKLQPLTSPIFLACMSRSVIHN
jgi:hypothetical protein